MIMPNPIPNMKRDPRMVEMGVGMQRYVEITTVIRKIGREEKEVSRDRIFSKERSLRL